MDKSTWVLLDEDARCNQLNNWLTQLVQFDELAERTDKDRDNKNEIEKEVFQALEWMKDYD